MLDVEMSLAFGDYALRNSKIALRNFDHLKTKERAEEQRSTSEELNNGNCAACMSSFRPHTFESNRVCSQSCSYRPDQDAAVIKV